MSVSVKLSGVLSASLPLLAQEDPQNEVMSCLCRGALLGSTHQVGGVDVLRVGALDRAAALHELRLHLLLAREHVGHGRREALHQGERALALLVRGKQLRLRLAQPLAHLRLRRHRAAPVLQPAGQRCSRTVTVAQSHSRTVGQRRSRSRCSVREYNGLVKW
eukprot:5934756-Pyramimonas_sp.AAC.2